MVIRRYIIEKRLKDLDETIHELSRYEGISVQQLRSDLSQRWIIERGMIVAAEIILDVSNHILVAHFGTHADTYEDVLLALRDKGVISSNLHQEIKSLGGFRNILVHRYHDIDLDQLLTHYNEGLDLFPRFAAEILVWLDSLPKSSPA